MQAPKICAVVHTSLLHRVHMTCCSVGFMALTLHILRLAGDGSVSYVEARQKRVRLAGIAVKEPPKKSCRP